MVLVIAPSAAWAQPTSPPERLLRHVPADAALVVVVPELEKLVMDVASFGRAVGHPHAAGLEPHKLLEELDLLDSIEGLDLCGPLVLAHKPGGGAPLLLGQVKDAAAWKAAVHAEEVPGGLLRVLVFGEPGYASVQDGILIVGETREDVTEAASAGGALLAPFRAATAKRAAGHDALLFIRTEPWKPLIEVTLTAAGAVLRAGAAISAPQDESVQQLWTWFFEQMGQFVTAIETCTIGVRLDEQEAFAEVALTFRPDGGVGRYLEQVGKSRESLLRGLPAERSMMVVAAEWTMPPDAPNLTNQLYEAMLATEALKQKLGTVAFEQGMQAAMKMNRLVSGYNMSLAAGPEAGLLVTGRYFTADPAGVLEHMRAAYQCSSEFLNPFGGGAMLDVTERIDQTGATPIQAFDLLFTLDDEPARRMLEAIYGKSTTMYTAAAPQGVVFALGPTGPARARLDQLLAAPASRPSGDLRLEAALARVAPGPQMFCTLDLPRFLEFVTNACRVAGAPLPDLECGEAPLPLIVAALYLEPQRVRAELRVPAAPIRQVVEGVRAAKRAKAGGQ
jgi:hypothetical protein